MNRKITIIRKLLTGSSLVSLLVFATEIPEALPAGFLEQLPVMMAMDADEYAAFLEFSRQQSVADRSMSKEEMKQGSQELNHED